jgi:hypothetical protein
MSSAILQKPFILKDFGQFLDEGFYLVPHAAVAIQGFPLSFGVLCEFGRVVESEVQYPGLAREQGAVLTGVIAEGDNVVKFDVQQVFDVLCALAGDIDARLGHYLDGVGIEAVSFNSG